eukprot:7382849-Prymnesium_polylepis.2
MTHASTVSTVVSGRPLWAVSRWCCAGSSHCPRLGRPRTHAGRATSGHGQRSMRCDAAMLHGSGLSLTPQPSGAF